MSNAINDASTLHPIGVPELADALCHVLGNTCRLARVAQCFGWNAMGRGALEAERCYLSQAEEMHTALDPIAQHIRMLGGVAVQDYSDDLVRISMPDSKLMPGLTEMTIAMSGAHEEICLSISAAIDVARGLDDPSSIQLLATRCGAHKIHAWRLTQLAADI
ncbi:MAG: ferritin-like domain-containing protein [Pseudomonadota bacterium]